MEAKYCSKCGKPIEPEKKKCSECQKKQIRTAVIIISTIVLIRLIVFGIELSMNVDEDLFEQDLKVNEYETQIEYERFDGSSENDGEYEKNQTVIDTHIASNESNSVNVSDYTPTYLFPSDTVYITEKDLRDLSKYEVALIRNEIYARHGYIFKQEEFKTYFNDQEWYNPNENFSTSLFNEIERTNVDFIANYEKKMDEILRNENFEERVDLGQHPFYDESVFSTFFDQKYGNDFNWSYIGATYSTFVVDGHESFDVYKIFFPNDVYGYYLVPFQDENGKNYSVYEFVGGEQLKLIWKQ